MLATEMSLFIGFWVSIFKCSAYEPPPRPPPLHHARSNSVARRRCTNVESRDSIFCLLLTKLFFFFYSGFPLCFIRLNRRHEWIGRVSSRGREPQDHNSSMHWTLFWIRTPENVLFPSSCCCLLFTHVCVCVCVCYYRMLVNKRVIRHCCKKLPTWSPSDASSCARDELCEVIWPKFTQCIGERIPGTWCLLRKTES